MATQDVLRQIPIFSALTDEQLQILADSSETLFLEANTVVFKENDTSFSMYVIVSGKVLIFREDEQGHRINLGRFEAGNFFGEVALLSNEPRTASITTLEPCEFLILTREKFLTLLATTHSQIALRIVGVLVDRIRTSSDTFFRAELKEQELRYQVEMERQRAQMELEAAAARQQQQKLAALGKLSAGLAHELNNPAAAAKRAASQLSTLFQSVQASALTLLSTLTPVQAQALYELQHIALEKKANQPHGAPLQDDDLEDELTSWLEDHQVSEAWKLAPSLVSAGLDSEWLDKVAAQIPDSTLSHIIAWITDTLNIVDLLGEVEHSTTRIFDLVKAVKAYSYMDQAPVQNVNVVEGLENTLTVMHHKLMNMTVVREYDAVLPTITAYGGELNQVWTNLIDNAADAMNGKGQLTLRTSHDQDTVIVEIIDNGPGISPEVQQHLFEPFYTTKPQGQGTGLGLDMVYRIIVKRHHGKVQVSSEPGRTSFQIRLPIEAKAEQQAR